MFLSRLFRIFALLLMGATSFTHAASKGEVLVLLSSETELPLQGKKSFPSGYYVNEFGVPADALIKAGYTLTIVTPKGNVPKPDVRSIDPLYFGKNRNEMLRIKKLTEQLTQAQNVRSLQDVMQQGLDRYSAIFIPGGHAPLIDLANNPMVGTTLQHFHRKGKPTAAICHGPITLLAAQKDPKAFEQSLIQNQKMNAEGWIYHGYQMTIFSNEEEHVFENSLHGDKLRYYPANAMEKAGGNMQFAKAWQPHVVIDRELITSQNPYSDHALAQALLKALATQTQHSPKI